MSAASITPAVAEPYYTIAYDEFSKKITDLICTHLKPQFVTIHTEYEKNKQAIDAWIDDKYESYVSVDAASSQYFSNEQAIKQDELYAVYPGENTNLLDSGVLASVLGTDQNSELNALTHAACFAYMTGDALMIRLWQVLDIKDFVQDFNDLTSTCECIYESRSVVYAKRYAPEFHVQEFKLSENPEHLDIHSKHMFGIYGYEKAMSKIETSKCVLAWLYRVLKPDVVGKISENAHKELSSFVIEDIYGKTSIIYCHPNMYKTAFTEFAKKKI